MRKIMHKYMYVVSALVPIHLHSFLLGFFILVFIIKYMYMYWCDIRSCVCVHVPS